MSILRVGSTDKYADGWDAAFGTGKKKTAVKKKVTAKKKATPKKKASKKTSKKR